MYSNYTPDIVLDDPSGRPLAWIEVKRTRPTSTRHASEYYRRVKDVVQSQGVRFFMLVAPDVVYLWDHKEQAINEGLANDQALSENLPKFLADRATTQADERTLEYAVYNWLIDLIVNEEKHQDPAEMMLRDAGFLAALKNADVRFGQAR